MLRGLILWQVLHTTPVVCIKDHITVTMVQHLLDSIEIAVSTLRLRTMASNVGFLSLPEHDPPTRLRHHYCFLHAEKLETMLLSCYT